MALESEDFQFEEDGNIITLPFQRVKKPPQIGLFVPNRDIPNLSVQNMINIGKLYFRTLADSDFFRMMGNKTKLPKPENAQEVKILRKMCLKQWEELPPEEIYNIVVRHEKSILNELMREYDKAIYFMLDDGQIVSGLFLAEKEKGFSLHGEFPFVENGKNDLLKVWKWLKFKKILFAELAKEGYKYLFAVSAHDQAKRLLEIIGTRDLKRKGKFELNKRFSSVKMLDSAVYNGKVTRYTQYRFRLG